MFFKVRSERKKPLTSNYLLLKVLESRTEDDILGVTSDGAFVLTPEEGPVVEVLEVVGLAEQKPWGDITGDGREVCTVVAVEHLLRTGGTHGSYE